MVKHYLRPQTIRKIEQELYDYKQTLAAIREIEEQLALPARPENETGTFGKGVYSDPTFRGASEMAELALLQSMRRWVRAIELALEELPADRRRWVELRYFHRPRLTLDEAAFRAGISLATAKRWRREFLSRIAELVGEW